MNNIGVFALVLMAILCVMGIEGSPGKEIQEIVDGYKYADRARADNYSDSYYKDKARESPKPFTSFGDSPGPIYYDTKPSPSNTIAGGQAPSESPVKTSRNK